jgi:hypothetical protein
LIIDIHQLGELLKRIKDNSCIAPLMRFAAPGSVL